jgi:hypothetical protein
MKIQFSILRNSLFVLILLLALPAFRAAAQSKPDSAPAAQANAAPQARQSKSQPGLKPVPRDGEELESLQEGADFLQRRQDWFFKPRAFPIGFIPQGARERALEQKRQMYQREGRFSLLAAPGGLGFVAPPAGPTSNWFSIGPQATSTPVFAPFTSGRVTALAANPLNASNVYLGGADGGLWVTTDGGATWFALAQTENPPNSGIPTIAVGSLAIDPSTCSASVCTTVYVGTGEDNFGAENIYGEGVLKCIVAAGPPPTATCTQDSSFHFTGGAPLDNLRGGPMIGALAVNPKTTSILLAGVRGLGTAIQSGIYCSSDSGVTWKPVFGITGIVGTDVAFTSDGFAFVALGFPFGDAANNGIYKSKVALTSCTTDPTGTAPSSSPNWTKQVLPAGTPASSLGRITLAVFPASLGATATVYAAIADSTTTSSNLLGLIKTTNGGTSWAPLTGDARLTTSGICNGQCFYDMPLAVSPASASDVFFGGAASNGTLIRSLDGGTTWTEISRRNVQGAADTIHVDMHAIAFSGTGGTMYVGNDGGAWKTATPTLAGTPPAGFWNNLNANLGITQFYPGVSIHPSNTGFSMGGTQDNDVQIYQGFTGPALLWQSAQIGCDGGFTAIDFTNPSTSFGECEYLPNIGFPFPVIITTFNGDGILGNGFFANSGIDPTDRGSFIPPLVMDPNTSTTLYFGTCSVWASKDGGNSWNTISPDVTTPSHPAACPVPTAQGQPAGTLSTIAVAQGNSNIIYVGSDDGDIEVTSNGGTLWASIATATLPVRAVTQVAVDPSTASTAYVTFSGFGSCSNSVVVCDGKGHVFKTVNGTAGAATTWVDVSGTTTKLPDIPVNAIVIDPNDATHNTLYVGTDIGGFFTTDGGLNWSPLGAASSLPNAQILSLTLHNPSRTLRAATHGRGVWDLSLGGAGAFSIASISPFTANAGAASITNFTVNGSGFTTNSVVKFTINGVATTLSPTAHSATSLTATIPVAQLVNGASATVTVTDPGQLNPTNGVPFTILNPIPVINTISPTTVTAGTTNFSLIVNGASIICGGATPTAVLFNGAVRSNITACSPTSLTVKLLDSDLTTAVPAPGVPIDLFTPQPGGGPDLNGTPPGLTITPSNNPVPTITSLSPPSATAGGPAFTLTVNGTNFVSAAVVSFGGLAKTTTFVSGTQLTVSILTSDIATAGTPAVTVQNPAPGGGISNSVTFTVNSGGTFTIIAGPATVTTTAGAAGTMSSTTSTITVTPSGGFSGAITLTCPSNTSTNLPPGVTCSGTIPAGSTTGTLTVNLLNPSAALTAMAPPATQNLWAASTPVTHNDRAGWWSLSAGTGFAALFLFFLPGRKRYRAAFGLGLLCILSFTLGCGSSGGGGGGPVATSTKLSVANSKLASNDPTGFRFTINIIASVGANAQVQLFDGSATLGAAVTASNGSATISTAGLAQGTHLITAHYLGDSKTQASQSGTLYVTVTTAAGTPAAVVPVTGTSGSTTANTTFNLTIN